MKIQILNQEGKKVSEKQTNLFEEPIREDIIAKVIEAEKLWHPYSNKFRAGMDISASGNVRHRRHVWKTDRGRGLARIPKKKMWRRGTQFSWEGAIVPFAKGGRRAHPPKGHLNDKKINKKELRKALLSALSYVSSVEELKKKYLSLREKKIDIQLPLVVENEVLGLKSVEFFDSLKKLVGEFYNIAVREKSIRAGKGKMRGRKYKKNAGVLFVIGKDEDIKTKGFEVVKISDLIVSDLASGGARLCVFSEKGIEELEGVLFKSEKSEKKVKSERVDKRKIKKENRKKIGKKRKTDNVKKDKENESKSGDESSQEAQELEDIKIKNNIKEDKK